MEIVRRDAYYGEPLPLSFFSDGAISNVEIARLRELVRVWPVARFRAEGRQVVFREPCLETVEETSNCFVVNAYWFPDGWIEPFAEDVESVAPSIGRLEIGYDYEEPLKDENAFLRIPRKNIQFEDGLKTVVDAFEIGEYPLTIGQFSRFAEDTAYFTDAEGRHEEHTYKANPRLEMIPSMKRSTFRAACLSYRDATAFCGWAHLRLPSEAEWLAASILDPRVIDDEEECRQVFDRLEKSPNALKDVGVEITSTTIGNQVVARRAPYLFWDKKATLKPSRNRMLMATNYFDIFTQFRVCRVK